MFFLREALGKTISHKSTDGSWTCYLIYGCTKLIGGLEQWNFITFHILGIIIPFDFHIFQRGRSTTNQVPYVSHLAF